MKKTREWGMVGGDMLKVKKNSSTNDTDKTFSNNLIGPTDDDYDKTVATSLFPESKEMSDYVEKLCESDEDPENAGLAQEIVNGENFLLHGEMTIANEEDRSSQASDEPKPKANLPRSNPLLTQRQITARVIEDAVTEVAVEATVAGTVAVEKGTRHNSAVISRRKSFGSKTPKQPLQPKPNVIDLTEHVQTITNQYRKPRNKSTFIYSPTTYSRTKALMETEPPLQVRPSCHYYGTKRIQNQGGGTAKQATHPTQPSPVKPKHMSTTSPLTKHPPSTSTVSKPGTNSSVVAIEPDSTSSQGPNKASKSGSSSGKGSKDRPSVSFLDDDVFEYTPTPPSSSSSYEKLVKNEDRYSKYELGKMANDRHKKLFQKTAELNEKLKEIKELERKMSRMKGSVTKLTNQLKDKNRILETQSTELLDLEGSKSDCEIFINKLKDDLVENQKNIESKSKELDAANKKSDRNERMLEEQRRLHQNLSLAHSTTLQKIKDLVEQRKKTELLHTAQIQDKDVMIRKLEQGLAQKMETVDELVRDKKAVEDLLLKARNEKATANAVSLSFVAPVTISPNVVKLHSSQETTASPNSPVAPVTISPNVVKLGSSQETTASPNSPVIIPEEETPKTKSPLQRKVKARGRPCRISIRELANMPPRFKGHKVRSPRKRVSNRHRLNIDSDIESDSTGSKPVVANTSSATSATAIHGKSPTTPVKTSPVKTSPVKTSPVKTNTRRTPVPPRTRSKSTSAVARIKRVRSLTPGSSKKVAVVRKRSRSEVQVERNTAVAGKRKRKPASRYSPSENKLDLPIKSTPEPEASTEEQTSLNTSVPEEQTDTETDKPTDKPTEKQADKQAEKQTDKQPDKHADEQIDKQTDKQTDKPVVQESDKQVTQVESTAPNHTEYSKFIVTAIEYVNRNDWIRKQELTETQDVDKTPSGSTNEEEKGSEMIVEKAKVIEVPSFRELSPLVLIHEEGEQARAFSKYKESDSLSNYTRMHRKCGTAEVRMMKQCERMRMQLEQRNKRKKLKEKPSSSAVSRDIYCKNSEHPLYITKCKHPCVSVFRCPLPVLKQQDFSLPWANEIKSFAYYAKPTSSRSAPDSAVTLYPLPPPPPPPPPPQPPEVTPPLAEEPESNPDTKPHITLIFSQSKDGIVVKTDKACSDVVSDGSVWSSPPMPVVNEEHVVPPVKSTNIWSNIQTTIASTLENSLTKNIFSQINEIRKTSSSGESSSKDGESLTSKRERLSSASNEQSPPKLPRLGVERRNIWDSWCATARTQAALEQPSSATFIPITSSSTEQSETIQNTSDTVHNTSESDESLGFDHKSFLLDACSSTERSPNLPPQPLTRKLEKLSKHKRPVLVCTNSINSSPRPSDDSFESSPAKTT